MEGEIVRAGFERKYLVPESEADALLSAVSALLPPDPYGATYPVASLYLDTPDLASYRREVLGKWRLRRYGNGDAVFAEFKAKPEPGTVHKRRTPATLEECHALPFGAKPGWFVRAIHKNTLQPTRMVSYERHAFVGVLEGEEVRLTLDQKVRASVCTTYQVPCSVVGGTPLTEGRILEIKYENFLPETLEKAVTALGLLPESFSKYRAAIDHAL